MFLYGIESGAVSSLVNLPTIFSFAIASAIMPSMSNKDNILNKNNKLNLILKIVLIISIPCLICFVFFPNQLINILYGNKLLSLNLNGNSIAAKLLTISSFGIIGLVVNQVFSTSLQAVNFRKVTIKNLAIAVVVKFIIEAVFMPFKSLNIYALAIANTVCYLLVFVLNNIKVNEVFKIKISSMFLGKLMICNFLFVATVVGLFMFSSGVIYSILTFMVGVLVYCSSLYYLKIFTYKDLISFKYNIK